MSAVTHWLNTSLHVWRPSLTPDGQGGFTEAFVDQGALEFKVDQSSAAEQQVAQQEEANHSHNAFTEPAADVHRNDRLAAAGVDLNALATGDVVYKVLSTTTPSTPRYLKCATERIETA